MLNILLFCIYTHAVRRKLRGSCGERVFVIFSYSAVVVRVFVIFSYSAVVVRVFVIFSYSAVVVRVSVIFSYSAVAPVNHICIL